LPKNNRNRYFSLFLLDRVERPKIHLKTLLPNKIYGCFIKI